ncbi:tRNA-(ms[2]io[6]A)-hydroxylase [Prochlorococcus sp. MIT 1307]|uniref:tRNA-(ms[2]io[6]A)-hydroxylase n=1 Tax=Prochlorococcus sp. MIT 1307 TaxID=3096219 RepID=UPI002A75A6DF|nr:tRNA-(ms[2]io[6]A)-hydroxylase [Prochlorococcus sp. MIT 1307]
MSALSGNNRFNARIKWLATATSDAWLQQAIENPIEVLIDHAHCERKAAGAAVQMMFRYLCEPGFAEALSPLAREELEHFEKVLAILKSRGHYLQALPAPPYGSALAKKIRRSEPGRMLDSLLVAGLIEARSHERMFLLASYSPDHELAKLYRELLESEARHFQLYLKLAQERFDKDLFTLRLKELADAEADIISVLHPEPRMHS